MYLNRMFARTSFVLLFRDYVLISEEKNVCYIELYDNDNFVYLDHSIFRIKV